MGFFVQVAGDALRATLSEINVRLGGRRLHGRAGFYRIADHAAHRHDHIRAAEALRDRAHVRSVAGVGPVRSLPIGDVAAILSEAEAVLVERERACQARVSRWTPTPDDIASPEYSTAKTRKKSIARR